MDSRQMKKEILYIALLNYQRTGSHLYDLGLALDKDPSNAQLVRYRRVLQKLVENAESKLE